MKADVALLVKNQVIWAVMLYYYYVEMLIEKSR